MGNAAYPQRSEPLLIKDPRMGPSPQNPCMQLQQNTTRVLLPQESLGHDRRVQRQA